MVTFVYEAWDWLNERFYDEDITLEITMQEAEWMLRDLESPLSIRNCHGIVGCFPIYL